MAKRIVMVGSALDVRGGVSAVVQVLRAHGLFDRWRATYLESHCDGTKARKALRAARAWLAFLGLLLTWRVALLHVHLNSDASFWRKALFVVPARALGVPYVLHVHCGDFTNFLRERLSPRARRFAVGLFADAAAVIALSEGTAAALAGALPGVDVQVVTNPVALPEWQASLDGVPTALFLGMIKDAKGVYDLLRAWPAVLAEVPDARLVMAGAGEQDLARALAEELGIGHSVTLPGWILGAEKAAQLRAASVFVLPSHWEAMPMSVLESMAAGLPVIATRVGGVPSAVEDGRCGILVEPRSVDELSRALVAVLGSTERRKAMGSAARRRAIRHFSAEVVVPRIESVWRRLAPAQELAGRADYHSAPSR